MSSQQDVIARLNREYDRSDGFLGLLRAGSFDPVGAQRLLDVLSSLDLGDGPVEKRLVQLLWFTPIFMQWQKERFELAGDSAEVVDPGSAFGPGEVLR